jgi:hypothetical protein
MTMAAPARTVTTRWPAVAVKSDVKTGHDIAYVTRGHAVLAKIYRQIRRYLSGRGPGSASPSVLVVLFGFDPLIVR